MSGQQGCPRIHSGEDVTNNEEEYEEECIRNSFELDVARVSRLLESFLYHVKEIFLRWNSDMEDICDSSDPVTANINNEIITLDNKIRECYHGVFDLETQKWIKEYYEGRCEDD